MKEESRTAVKLEVEHEHVHETPTVIHNPEEDMTLLARWLYHGMKQGASFWVMLAGVVAVIVILPFVVGGVVGSESKETKAWSQLILSTTPAQKVEVADEHPNTDVANAARLQAATNYFADAVRALPNDRESATAKLKTALELFQAVAKNAPKDSPQALEATFDAARVLEARNELPEAITQYKAVIAGWPTTTEAKQAERLIKRLEDPEVVNFYKELYAFKAPTAPSPSGLPGLGGLGDLPLNHPPIDGPTVPASAIPGLPPLPNIPPSTGSPLGTNPLDIAPPPAVEPAKPAMPATKPAETPKAAEPAKPAATTPAKPAETKPADAAKPAPKAELPADVFKNDAKPAAKP